MENIDEVVSWLLASKVPSIRYWTHLKILSKEPGDTVLDESTREMMATGPVPNILRAQHEAGNWVHERSYYTPKYTSSHWSMMLLSELGVNTANSSARLGAQHMLEVTKEELASASDSRIPDWVCFWGNLLRYAVQFGFENDQRVIAILKHIAFTASDGKWRCRYNRDLSCAWGAARALWGLAAIGEGHRTMDWHQAVDHALSFLLEEYNFVQADYPPRTSKNPLWHSLGFPLFYQANILFVLRV
jgi:hypothetical protein